MFVITTGSQVSKMIEILSIVGEFPFSAIRMLGKRNYIYNQIYKHIHVNDYSVPGAAEIIRCQLFQLSGRGALKTIRFHKSGLQVLEQWNKAAYLSYMNSFDQHFFRSDDEHITRNHRIAESAVMCLNAGIEIRPDQVPQLTKMHHQVLPFDEPVFYLSKHLKKTDPDGLNKTKYARIVGALFYQTGCYAVYNLRDALMKWKPESELKSKLDLTDICTMNTSNKEVNSAIFFGASYQTGLRMLQEWKTNRDNRKLFTSVYQHVHFIPIDDFGTELLRIITLPNWNNRLLGLFFKNSVRTFGCGEFTYDAEVKGICYLSFLDSDVARLYLFREGIKFFPERKWSVICFEQQVHFLREFLGKNASLKILKIENVMGLLKLNGGNSNE